MNRPPWIASMTIILTKDSLTLIQRWLSGCTSWHKVHNRWVIIKTSDTLNCIQCFVCGFCFVWCHCPTINMTSFAIFSWYNQLLEELTNSKAGLCDCELVRHCRHAIADKCHLLWSSWYVLQNVWQQPCVHQCFLTETSIHFLFSFPGRQYFLQILIPGDIFFQLVSNQNFTLQTVSTCQWIASRDLIARDFLRDVEIEKEKGGRPLLVFFFQPKLP